MVYECVIELFWWQTTPHDWLAVLTDQRTGRRCEARSKAELLAALQSFLEIEAESPEGERSRGKGGPLRDSG